MVYLREMKLGRLREIFRGLESAVVTFSGGVDSSLLVKIARDELGDRAVALTAKSSALAASEFDDARRVAESVGIRHVVLNYEETDNADYAANPSNRCYFCKNMLYKRAREFADANGFRHVVNGFNVDDVRDDRPGQIAAAEFGIRSPLFEASLTKAEIRAISQSLGLPTFDKPEMACLASRIPHGEPVTIGKLNTVERAEAYIRGLGFRQLRVRHHGRRARVEVEPADISRAAARIRDIEAHLKLLGFDHVDLRGYSRAK